MTRSTAFVMPAVPSRPAVVPLPTRTRNFVPSASYRYDSGPRNRKRTVFAALLSAALHAGIILGIGPAEQKATPAAGDYLIPINLEFAQVEELEEPEPLAADDAGEELEPGVLVPMIADSPQVPQPTDFVQPLDFASMIEQPQMNTANLTAIPDHISRGGKIGKDIGSIFNLADLDRAPVAVFQGAPMVPASLKQAGATATVRVHFIITAEGRVVNVIAVESTDQRFSDAAVNGVQKWKFKPGIKGGRKVNTQMGVPIFFSVTDPLD